MPNKTWSAPPRFLFRKHNVLHELRKHNDISNFIDMGCGAGGMACMLVQELGIPGKGVDFSKKAIAKANELKKTFGLGLQPVFECIDGKAYKSKDKADLVTCFEVLEHVEDDEALLRNLIEHSKKYVMVSVPAKKKLFDRTDELAGHFRRYEKHELQDLLTRNNLEILSFVSYGYPYTNVLRVLNKQIAKRKKHADNQQNMEERSKKSGVDLLDLNKFIPDLNKLIIPFYHTSRLFNALDLAEGYLMLCKKKWSRLP